MSELKPSNERNGHFLDRRCKVCDGELPDGHLDHCDIWKKKHRDFLANEYSTLLMEHDKLRAELTEVRKLLRYCDEAKKWPARFLSAIEPGADLSRVYDLWSAWNLIDPGVITLVTDEFPEIQKIIRETGDACLSGLRISEVAEVARAARAAGAAYYKKALDKLIELLEAA